LGAECFLADGRADRRTGIHTQTNSRFSQFCDEHKNYYITLIYAPRKTLLGISAFKQQHISSRKKNKHNGEVLHAQKTINHNCNQWEWSIIYNKTFYNKNGNMFQLICNTVLRKNWDLTRKYRYVIYTLFTISGFTFL